MNKKSVVVLIVLVLFTVLVAGSVVAQSQGGFSPMDTLGKVWDKVVGLLEPAMDYLGGMDLTKIDSDKRTANFVLISLSLIVFILTHHALRTRAQSMTSGSRIVLALIAGVAAFAIPKFLLSLFGEIVSVVVYVLFFGALVFLPFALFHRVWAHFENANWKRLISGAILAITGYIIGKVLLSPNKPSGGGMDEYLWLFGKGFFIVGIALMVFGALGFIFGGVTFGQVGSGAGGFLSRLFNRGGGRSDPGPFPEIDTTLRDLDPNIPTTPTTPPVDPGQAERIAELEARLQQMRTEGEQQVERLEAMQQEIADKEAEHLRSAEESDRGLKELIEQVDQLRNMLEEEQKKRENQVEEFTKKLEEERNAAHDLLEEERDRVAKEIERLHQQAAQKEAEGDMDAQHEAALVEDKLREKFKQDKESIVQQYNELENGLKEQIKHRDTNINHLWTSLTTAANKLLAEEQKAEQSHMELVEEQRQKLVLEQQLTKVEELMVQREKQSTKAARRIKKSQKGLQMLQISLAEQKLGKARQRTTRRQIKFNEKAYEELLRLLKEDNTTKQLTRTMVDCLHPSHLHNPEYEKRLDNVIDVLATTSKKKLRRDELLKSLFAKANKSLTSERSTKYTARKLNLAAGRTVKNLAAEAEKRSGLMRKRRR